MTAELNLREDAPWKDRFRAPSILFAYTASANPDRGLVVSDQDGIIQLYGWDVPSGELTQATRSETGVVFGNLSSDGQYIYYLNDDGGNEIGHFHARAQRWPGRTGRPHARYGAIRRLYVPGIRQWQRAGFHRRHQSRQPRLRAAKWRPVARPAPHDETSLRAALFCGWRPGHSGDQRTL